MTNTQVQLLVRTDNQTRQEKTSRRKKHPYVAIFDEDEGIREIISDIITTECQLKTLEASSMHSLLSPSSLGLANQMKSPLLQAVVADVGFRGDLQQVHALNTLLQSGIIHADASLILMSTEPAHLEKIASYRLDTRGLHTVGKPFDYDEFVGIMKTALQETSSRKEGRLFTFPESVTLRKTREAALTPIHMRR